MRGGLRALALATVLAVLLPAAALASVGVVRLSVTPSTTTPGQSVTLAGSGCPPGARVFIDLQGPLWATTADADGSYRTTFQVPGGTNPGPMRIHATCGNRRSPTTTLTVRYSSMLPFTGPHPRMPLVVLGFGLVAAGVAALWLSRGVALQGTRPGAAGKAAPAALHSAAVIEVALGPAAAKYRCRRRRGGEMRDASEQDLVARLGTDPAAFEEFYRRHVDAVTRLAVRRVGQPGPGGRPGRRGVPGGHRVGRSVRPRSWGADRLGHGGRGQPGRGCWLPTTTPSWRPRSGIAAPQLADVGSRTGPGRPGRRGRRRRPARSGRGDRTPAGHQAGRGPVRQDAGAPAGRGPSRRDDLGRPRAGQGRELDPPVGRRLPGATVGDRVDLPHRPGPGQPPALGGRRVTQPP
jgi:hypothetical protein